MHSISRKVDVKTKIVSDILVAKMGPSGCENHLKIEIQSGIILTSIYNATILNVAISILV